MLNVAPVMNRAYLPSCEPWERMSVT